MKKRKKKKKNFFNNIKFKKSWLDYLNKKVSKKLNLFKKGNIEFPFLNKSDYKHYLTDLMFLNKSFNKIKTLLRLIKPFIKQKTF